jgi:hypothetical protein
VLELETVKLAYLSGRERGLALPYVGESFLRFSKLDQLRSELLIFNVSGGKPPFPTPR